MPSAPVSSTTGRIAFQAFLARHHQRGDDGAVGPVHLDLLDLAQVGVQVAVGDQLDVVEAEQAAVGAPDRAVARAVDVDDRRAFLAERLPDHAAPARLEGADDVVGLVGRRRGGQPERVGRFDADEIVADICHVHVPLKPAIRPISGARLIDSAASRPLRDGRDGQVVAAERCSRRRPRPGKRRAPFVVDLDAAAFHAIETPLPLSAAGSKLWPIALNTWSAAMPPISPVPVSLSPFIGGIFELDAGDLAAFGNDLLRLQPVADDDAVGGRQILLEFGGVHVLLAAAVADRHFLGAEQLRLHGGVDGGHAAAETTTRRPTGRPARSLDWRRWR
jgi:hypothetical protein